MSRSTHARAILGGDYERLESTKVLLVGAGGIGCELCAWFTRIVRSQRTDESGQQ